ncbi:hypothetical protein [Kutzneria kofuensis]|uniref:Uncharacterized protein n=1 Tax=Kutzneria kofuensis TaxID=103725 RepID=A0A7W9KIY7_9PSEU|nr:hypothetical protein [Kutzneria kofuensis]MBB5892684.1 hypothetical protein [Kutzneria kofuensis]
MITGGGRLRRALSRALLTVGGAAGLTAAAWCLSTACASAGTLGDHLPVANPVNHAVVTQGHSPETASADNGVHEMARAVATASKPAVSSLDEHQTLASGASLPSSADFDRFAHQVQDDFVRVGRHVATPAPSALVGDSVTLVRHVVQFPLATLPVRLPIPVIGDLSGASTSTDGRQQPVSPTGSDPAGATGSATSAAFVGASAAASTVRHPLPPYRSSDLSGPRNSTPLPAVPAQAPSAPCCFGHGGPGTPGAPTSGQLPFGSTLGAAAYRSVVATSQSVSVLTGKQAGITPD